MSILGTVLGGGGGGSGDALTTNPLSQFAATTSLQLKNTISDETGSGALVFATSPTLVTPLLGTPTSGVLTNCTGYPASALPAGSVVQVVNYQTGAVATGTTVIPPDDTIPQNSEGDEYMTLAITPSNVSNKLFITVNIGLMASSGVAGAMTVGLFQDSTANALAVNSQNSIGAGSYLNSTFNHCMTAGTTSATTFKVRVGCSSAGTTTFNGSAGSRVFGGVAVSSITITEIKV